MEESRTDRTKKNLISGLVCRFISIVFPFAIRTVILYYLGEKYLGLSSLFTSILQVLNLSELGFSTAVIYNMYKPIVNNDIKTINALLNYYKKVYFIIGMIILIFGVILTPFITYLINDEWPSEINIYLLYLLYLFDSSISYFLFAYNSSLLNALQKLDIVNIIQIVVYIVKYLLQILSIMILKNYYLFVIISIVSTTTINILCSLYIRKFYPQYKCDGEISDNQKSNVKKQVSGLMIGKLSDVSRNSFDSIILSTLFGLTTVAIYNNYYYVFSSVYAIMLVITHSMQASIGNSIANESIEKNYNDFLNFQFIFNCIICFCTVSLTCLYQPFMKIWVGDDLLLNELDMILFCVYFYVLNINNNKNLYFTGSGLWWKAKVTFILESLFNLVLNIILGIIFGTAGVIIATIITILIFNFILRVNILFKEYFKKSPNHYYRKMLVYSIVTMFLTTIAYFICKSILIEGVLKIIINLLVSTFISLLFIVFFIRTDEFKNMFKLLKKIIK